MKRIKIYVQQKVNGETDVVEVFAEKYDDHTYLVSEKWKENKDNPYVKKYALIDAGTGLVVVIDTNKKSLIEKYNKRFDDYMHIVNGQLYKRYIKEYQALCERAKNNKVDDCEVER